MVAGPLGAALAWWLFHRIAGAAADRVRGGFSGEAYSWSDLGFFLLGTFCGSAAFGFVAAACLLFLFRPRYSENVTTPPRRDSAKSKVIYTLAVIVTTLVVVWAGAAGGNALLHELPLEWPRMTPEFGEAVWLVAIPSIVVGLVGLVLGGVFGVPVGGGIGEWISNRNP